MRCARFVGLLSCLVGQVLHADGRQSVDRVVVIKADGVPQAVLEQYIAANPRGNLAERFARNGVTLDNFYTRGISLSAPSWSLLDTGRHLEIHGNVEYDRYTLRPWDYLNFFPFYVSYALLHEVDMPGVQLLDEQKNDEPLSAQHRPVLFIDRFPFEGRYLSFQLLQRGVRWTTLQDSLKKEFTKRPWKELFDEWQTGFTLSDSVMLAQEIELERSLQNPQVRYLDYFTGEYDHVAHLTADRTVQMHALDSLDSTVGRIWKAIQNSPLAQTTALVLVSDHGMNTDERVVSQGYNLVDWFGSKEGGGHHVITDRHPLTEFKLKGLNPFVSAVVTAGAGATYLEGRSVDFPTVVLDLDGNERANIGLRDNTLNVLQILADQLSDRRVTGQLRVAAMNAFLQTLDEKRPMWERVASRLQKNLDATEHRIQQAEAVAVPKKRKWPQADRDLGLDKDARRAAAQVERWKSEQRADEAYLDSLQRLLVLTAADFDPGKAQNGKLQNIIPRRSLGELNTLHDLQNYVVGPSPQGLALDENGELDLTKSFRRINYFAALSGLAVRNNVQKNVVAAPVDFIAVRVTADKLREALGDTALQDGVWLYAQSGQALILTRADGTLRYLPVKGLTEDRAGRLHFETCDFSPGLPLAYFEDPDLDVPAKAKWLSAWHGERDWLQAVHRTRYSNGIIGLTEQLLDAGGSGLFASRRERLRTDLLVFASDHWNFNVRGFNPGGNHGSFLRTSTHSVWMMAGGGQTEIGKGVHVQTPYDSLSFLPTILQMMGKPEADLPGPVVREVTVKEVVVQDSVASR